MCDTDHRLVPNIPSTGWGHTIYNLSPLDLVRIKAKKQGGGIKHCVTKQDQCGIRCARTGLLSLIGQLDYIRRVSIVFFRLRKDTRDGEWITR